MNNTTTGKGDSGRSMIEMLGVLAIVGILTVGGINGFHKAMRKYKYTEATSELSLFINNLLQHKDTLYKQIAYNSSVGKNEFQFAAYVPQMGFMPNKWTQSGIYLYDALGGQIKPFARNDSNNAAGNRISFDYTYKYSTEKDIKRDYCLNIFEKIVLPYQDVLQNVHANVGGAKKAYYYGSSTCSKASKKECISDMTMNTILNFCGQCTKNVECRVIFDFDT
jgi:type II secretory pathway pseudopilin PulG